MPEQYQLLEEIGRGPHTVVHVAWDASVLRRKVAIRALNAKAAADSDVVRRFWSEAEFLAKHRHDRLIPVYGVDESQRWIIMELADGSLAESIATRQASVDEVRSVLAQALEGLSVFHRAGCTHSSLKPSNILKYANGGVKLSDPAGATADGTIPYPFGEEKYLTPELTNPDRWGSDVGPQSDLYVLGFIGLEMLAGPEFASHFPGMTAGGADQAMLWTRYHAGEEDPRKLAAKLCPGSGPLQTALTLLLAKDPQERAKDAESVLKALGSEAIPQALKQGASSLDAASSTAALATPAAAVSSPTFAAGATSIGASAPAPSAPKAKAKSFLEDTRKTAIVAAGMVLGGLIAVFLLDDPAPPPSNHLASFISDPAGAQLVIDGKETKHRTPKSGPLVAGKHSIQVKWSDGTVSPPQSLTIPDEPPKEDAKPFEIVFTRTSETAASEATSEPTAMPEPTTTPKPTAPPKPTSIVVQATPGTATVLVDGAPQPLVAGALTAQLKEGAPTVRIEVKAEGYESAVRLLTRESIETAKSPTTIYLNPFVVVSPADAVVTIDGQPVAVAAGKFVLPLGEKPSVVVQAVAAGHEPKSERIARGSINGAYSLSLTPIPPMPSKSVAWLQPAGVVIDHGARVRALAVPPQGDRIASAATDGELVVASVRGPDAPVRVKAFTERGEIVTALSFNTDGTSLIAGSSRGRIRIISLAPGEDLALETLPDRDAGGALIPADAPNDKRVVLALAPDRVADHEVIVASYSSASTDFVACYLGDGSQQRWSKTLGEPAWDVAVLGDRGRAAWASNGRLRVYPTNDETTTEVELGFPAQAFRLAVSGDRIAAGLQSLATDEPGGMIAVWDRERQRVVSWKAHTAAVSGLAFVDETHLVSTDRSGAIVVSECPRLPTELNAVSPARVAFDDGSGVASKAASLQVDSPILVAEFHHATQQLFCGLENGRVHCYSAAPLPKDRAPIDAREVPAQGDPASKTKSTPAPNDREVRRISDGEEATIADQQAAR